MIGSVKNLLLDLLTLPLVPIGGEFKLRLAVIGFKLAVIIERPLLYAMLAENLVVL